MSKGALQNMESVLALSLLRKILHFSLFKTLLIMNELLLLKKTIILFFFKIPLNSDVAKTKSPETSEGSILVPDTLKILSIF